MISEIRDLEKTWIPDKDLPHRMMTAEQALHWLTLRICINNDIADYLRANVNSGITQNRPPDERQAAMVHLSLMWHCASIRSLSSRSLEDQFSNFVRERFGKSKEIPKLAMISKLKEFINRVFPHISTSVGATDSSRSLR